MRVILTVQAELDLEEIGDYIAADNPERALSLVGELRAHCCERIGKSAYAYQARPKLGEGMRTKLA